jgi:transporter family protein
MPGWIWYAVGAAFLYGLHQIFTKLAAERVSDGIGSLVVEASAVLTIALYLGGMWTTGNWRQSVTPIGVLYAVITGVCVGAGTILFFLLFQAGGPLSAVPAILAGGAAVMALAAILFFGEEPSPRRLVSIALAITALYLLMKTEPR